MRAPLAGLLILATCLTAPAAQAFRCGNELVQKGDRKFDVVEKCGEPDFRESHAGGYLPGVGPVNITETWYYDEGPSRLLRILTFRRGRLRAIETGGRGFNDGGGRSCQPYELVVGMSKYELLSVCGEPAARDSWREPGGYRIHRGYGSRGSVLVEEWIYAFGSNRFRRYVRIVNGRVVAVESGARGG